MQNFTVVSNTGGQHEFEVHAKDCQHSTKNRIHFCANSYDVQGESAKAVVDIEVADFQAQDQGWEHNDFRIFPCAKAAKPVMSKSELLLAFGWDNSATVGANAKRLRTGGASWTDIVALAHKSCAIDGTDAKGAYKYADRLAAAAKKEG